MFCTDVHMEITYDLGGREFPAMVLSTEKEAKSDEGAWNAFIEGWFNCHRKSAHRKRCLTLPMHYFTVLALPGELLSGIK